jgi:DNA topoisomerase-1
VIYLATDPDREGEAIAWHVSAAARLDKARVRRVAFYQVTKAAVQEALANPRDLDMHLIDAQQARRVLDRLVGYQVSPLLSRSIRKGYATRRPLSAGRVQSVALRLTVEREREILAFVPEEYWSLQADLRRRIAGREAFRARLLKVRGEEPALSSKDQVDRILAELEQAQYRVTAVRPGQRQQRPQPPFITSTLQTTAASRLHYSPRQTMRLAQQLYEGIDLEGERVGLITYMRTDSPHVAPEAQQEARELIAARWGADHLPEQAPQYQAGSSAAQEAHEAIRPTSVQRTPEAMRPHLDDRQARLYELIWRRFVASQMKPALFATLAVDVLANTDYLFRATGRRLLFAGYLVVYTEEGDETGDQELPPLQEQELLDLLKLLPEQHFTEPPPRYSESTLIKELEKNGVGRPSTYASIVSVIQDRNYVEKVGGRLKPTALGMVVCDALVEAFADIMQVQYTAGMEQQLDQIAAGELGYRAMLEGFYKGFASELEQAGQAMPKAVERALWADLPEALRERACPQCGKPLQARLSDAGRFLGCSGYPECRYILDLSNPQQPKEPDQEAQFAEGEVCEKCGGRMKVITFRNRQFLGCEHYPKCKTTRPILSPEIKRLAAETPCPTCGAQPLDARSGRFGEYLHCPQCDANISLRKLGISTRKAEAREQGGEQAKPAPTTAETEIRCPGCGQGTLEQKPGRWGPYYRCAACKTNYSQSKLKKLLGPDALGEADDV